METKIDERQQRISKLQKRLTDIELEQRNGGRYYTIDDLEVALHKIIDNA